MTVSHGQRDNGPSKPIKPNLDRRSQSKNSLSLVAYDNLFKKRSYVAATSSSPIQDVSGRGLGTWSGERPNNEAPDITSRVLQIRTFGTRIQSFMTSRECWDDWPGAPFRGHLESLFPNRHFAANGPKQIDQRIRG